MPTPLQYIQTLEEPRASEMKKLFKVIKEAAPKFKPFVHETMHGTIIGFGKTAYETKSGCSGDWFALGMASRKQGLAVYVCSAKDGKYLLEYYKKDFPKQKMGRSCITFKKFEDINLPALKKILKEAQKLGMCFG